MARWETTRPLERTHASDVTSERLEWCPRSIALMEVTGRRPSPQLVGTVDELVFYQGRALAERVVHWLADGGLAVGDWKCRSCGSLATFILRPEKCETCRAQCWSYSEVRFTSQTTGISGSIDVLVRLPSQNRLRVVEIKTMDKEKFKALAMPLAEHRVRTSLYLQVIEDSGHPFASLVDVSKATLLYVSKGGWGVPSVDPEKWGIVDRSWSPFKEFDLVRSDLWTRRLWERARELHTWRLKGSPLPQRICRAAECERAKDCVVASQCWSTP